MITLRPVPLRIGSQTLRRYVLGCQGLWPGRRWSGVNGTRSALRAVQAVQVDPLNVVARSHDIALHGRVDDYRPELLNTLLYDKREFFDYGGVVFVFPMEELPHFRVAMLRRTADRRLASFAAENDGVIKAMRSEVERRGPLASRDLSGTVRSGSFRSGKDTGQALYYLWMTGELMTHSRRGFERLYDLTERVAPAAYHRCSRVAEAEAFLARKAIDFVGVATARTWLEWFSTFAYRRVDRHEGQTRLQAMVGDGVVSAVEVVGRGEQHYVLTERIPMLESLQAGDVPAEWQVGGAARQDQATFLAPLDIVSARGRAQKLFDFEYVWEVYKPAAKRRWGYYTLPVLYGDRLVARIDPKMDRASGTLILNGLWLEEPALARDDLFLDALAGALVALGRFSGGTGHDLSAVRPAALAAQVRKKVKQIAAGG